MIVVILFVLVSLLCFVFYKNQWLYMRGGEHVKLVMWMRDNLHLTTSKAVGYIRSFVLFLFILTLISAVYLNYFYLPEYQIKLDSEADVFVQIREIGGDIADKVALFFKENTWAVYMLFLSIAIYWNYSSFKDKEWVYEHRHPSRRTTVYIIRELFGKRVSRIINIIMSTSFLLMILGATIYYFYETYFITK